MSYRTLMSIAAAAVLGLACLSTDALARGGARGGGGHVGGVHAGGVHVAGARGVGVVRHPVAAVGVGAAVRGAGCGYYPYPPCY
jgi:hypothetical protein